MFRCELVIVVSHGYGQCFHYRIEKRGRTCILTCTSLRSAEQGDLVVPGVRLATAQRRSFAVVGPSFWNALPSRLRCSNFFCTCVLEYFSQYINITIK